MSGSSGGKRTQIGLIAGIILSALISASVIGWGLLRSADYQWQADYHASQNTDDTNRKIGQSCRSLAPAEKQECLTQARNEHRAYERDEQDLVAQRQSALWAYIMAAAAVIGVALSVVGVFLIWTTFHETREANRLTQAEQRPWLNFEIIKVAMTHKAKVVYDSHGGIVREELEKYPPSIEFHYIVVNQGKSPAYDIDWRSQHLRGEWSQQDGPDIYAPNDRAFYERVIGERPGLFIKCLIPGESVSMTATTGITDETLSEEPVAGAPRLLPRYAALVTYRGKGIDGSGETGKVFCFYPDTGVQITPNDGVDYDGYLVTAAVAERATHVV